MICVSIIYTYVLEIKILHIYQVQKYFKFILQSCELGHHLVWKACTNVLEEHLLDSF